MSTLDSVWASTQADSNTDGNPAPAGYIGVVRVADVRSGKSKKGEEYFLVELADDQQGYRWPIYKQLTKNGQPHDGSVKSAKITLRQLGIEVASPAHLGVALKQLVGRYYAVEQIASDRLNQVTGTPYVNTQITGAASAPTLSPPTQYAQPAPAVQAPTQVQTPQGVASFPPAVPQGQTLDQAMTAGQSAGFAAPAAQMQQQVQQAAATQTNDIPWETGPQGVQPSVIQQG